MAYLAYDLASSTIITPLKPIAQILARLHEPVVLRAGIDAAAGEAAAVDAVLGADAVAGRLGVVGAAVAGALFGDDADGEEGDEEGDGGGETHFDNLVERERELVWV